MKREEVKHWTFGYEDGNIIINFDQESRYITVTPRDIVSMASWIMMTQDTYKIGWHKGLIRKD